MKKHTIRITEEQFKYLQNLREDDSTTYSAADINTPADLSAIQSTSGSNKIKLADNGKTSAASNSIQISDPIHKDYKPDLQKAKANPNNISVEIDAENLNYGTLDKLKNDVKAAGLQSEEKTFSKKQLKEMKVQYLNSIGTKFSKKDIYKK